MQFLETVLSDNFFPCSLPQRKLTSQGEGDKINCPYIYIHLKDIIKASVESNNKINMLLLGNNFILIQKNYPPRKMHIFLQLFFKEELYKP